MTMPRASEVLLITGAELDLTDIHAFIQRGDGAQRANQVLDAIQRTVASLTHFPERGGIPPELLALGIREYRQRCACAGASSIAYWGSASSFI